MLDEARAMQEGLRARVAALARRVRGQVVSPTGLLALLSSGAVAPVAVAAAGVTGGTAVAAVGVLGAVGANALGQLIDDAIGRSRGPVGAGPVDAGQLGEILAERIEAVLAEGGAAAAELREDLAAVLEAIDAGTVAVQAAVATGDAEVTGLVVGALRSLADDVAGFRHALVDAVASVHRELQDQSALHRSSLHVAQESLRQLRQLRVELERLPAVGSGRPGRDGSTHGGDGVAAGRWRRESPYRGLAPFRPDDADVFFGRSALVGDLVDKVGARVAGPSVVVVTGASGVGKSSLLAAGLLPALRAGELAVPGAEEWPQVVMEPTEAPLAELASQLAILGGESPASLEQQLVDDPEAARVLVRRTVVRHRQASVTGDSVPPADAVEDRLVLVVDQFEQLFTPAAADDDREASAVPSRFVAALLAASSTGPGARAVPPAVVVIAVRTDHLDRCAALPGLAEVMQDGRFLVPPMDEQSLRDAIAAPAAAAGRSLDPTLVDDVLADVRTRQEGAFDVAALPLLSQAMLATWEQSGGGRLTLDAYRAGGGVASAVEQRATEAYEELTPDRRSLARDVFLCLTSMSHGGSVSRRPVAVGELAAMVSRSPADDDLRAVLDVFTARRLLVQDRATVQIAHDTLLSAWEELKRWLEDARDLRVRYDRLIERASAWDAEGREPSYLYRGAELAAARDVCADAGDGTGRLPALTEQAQRFLDASVAADEGARRRRTIGVAALGAVVIGVSVLGSLLAYQRNVAGREEARSDSRQLAALSTDSAPLDPAFSVLAALAAYEREPTEEAESALFRAYVEHHEHEALLSGVAGDLSTIGVSHDGRTVAGEADGVVTVWRREPGRSVTSRNVRLASESGIMAFPFDVADDGETVLMVERDTVWLHDVASGERLWDITVEGDDERVGHAWVADDDRVVMVVEDPTLIPGPAARIEVWEPVGGESRLVGTYDGVVIPETLGYLTFPIGVLSRSGDLVVEHSTEVGGRNRILRWDPETGERETLLDGTSEPLHYANDRVVTCHGRPTDDVNTLAVIDLTDGSERRLRLPDGETCPGLVSADARAEVVAARGWVADFPSREVRRLPTDAEVIRSSPDNLVTTEDGRRLFATHGDRELRLEDVTSPTQTWSTRHAQLTHDGRHVVGVTAGGRELTVVPTDADGRTSTGERPSAFRAPGSDGLAISPDDRLVADRVAADRVEIRRLPGLEPVTELRTPAIQLAGDEPSPGTSSLEFTDRHLVTKVEQQLQWWDPATGELVRRFDLRRDVADAPDGARAYSLHPDPSLIVVAVAGEPGARVLDVATGRQVDAYHLGGEVADLSVDDARYVTVIRPDDRLEIWDRRQRRATLGPVDVRLSRRPELFDPDDDSVDTGLVRGGSREFGYLIGDTAGLRWFRPGAQLPLRSLSLGDDRWPTSISDDGHFLTYADAALRLPGTELYTDEATAGHVLDLRPGAWVRKLCALIDNRRFTSDEMATVRTAVEDDAPCR